jgi:hypothetical protein
MTDAHVLIMMGSPRKNGNIGALVEQIAKGIVSIGGEAETIYLPRPRSDRLIRQPFRNIGYSAVQLASRRGWQPHQYPRAIADTSHNGHGTPIVALRQNPLARPC